MFPLDDQTAGPNEPKFFVDGSLGVTGSKKIFKNFLNGQRQAFQVVSYKSFEFSSIISFLLEYV